MSSRAGRAGDGEPGVLRADDVLAQAASARVDELLELVRMYARVDVAFVGEFSHGRRIVRFVRGEGPAATALVDRGDELGQTYCQLIAEERVPPVIPDVHEIPELASLPITAELDIGCYVGVPIHLSDGTLYGTLCGFSPRPLDSLAPDLGWLLQVVATLLARRLEAPQDPFIDVLAIHERVQAVLDEPDRLTVAYQPIVALGTADVAGYEALARFPGVATEPPDVWFADSHQAGLGVELELLAVGRALSGAADLAPDAFLAVNVGADALCADGLEAALDGFDPARLVLELTEHQTDRGGALLERLQALRRAGYRVAVDDLGAGFASLTRLLEIDPEVVKLDRFLTIGVSGDVRRGAMAAAAVCFCEGTGATLVAEGVESAADRASLEALRVPLAQGLLFGGPGPIGAS